jgi:hypothetical protein
MNCETCVYYKVCARLGGLEEHGCLDYYYQSMTGVDIKLPGAIGSTIYYIDASNTIQVDTIKFFTITGSGIKPILQKHNTKFWDQYKWGINVFTSETEAKRALARK